MSDDRSRAPRFRLRRFELRRFQLITAITLTALTIFACAALKILTDLDAVRTQHMQNATDARQSAHQLQVHMLEYSRVANLVRVTHDPNDEADRADSMRQVFHDLDSLHALVEPSERAAIDKADTQVRDYFSERQRVDSSGATADAALIRVTPTLNAALGSLREIADTEGRRGGEEQAGVHAWSRIADIIGWAVAIVVTLSSAAALFVSYHGTINPLLALTRAMKSFALGDRSARAEPSDAIELATAAENFNEMADIISGQHKRMLDYLGSISREIRRAAPGHADDARGVRTSQAAAAGAEGAHQARRSGPPARAPRQAHGHLPRRESHRVAAD